MNDQQPWVIKNGTIYNGSGETPFKADLKIVGNTITEIAPAIDAGSSQVLEATGLIVAPGLIDLHVHVYDGMNLHSIAPADAGLKTGVTTLLDLGSAGAMNYGTFHKYVMPQAHEDVFALLNISCFGVQGHPEIPPYIGDLHDTLHFDISAAIRCIRAHPDRILGVKVRLTASLADNDPQKERAALQAALAVRDATGLPCYVHHVMSAIPLEELLSQLKAGDVLTHFYHEKGDGGFTAPDGAPGLALQSARQRGVYLDVGHGSGCFAWGIADPACRAHNFWPDTISTDIHIFNIESPVVDLPTTMSKFLYLGMSLEQIIHRTTLNPARVMRLHDRYGSLQVGRKADISLLELREGSYSLIDSEGVERLVRQKLFPMHAFKNGIYHPCTGLKGRQLATASS